MRRFMRTCLFASTVLVGLLSLSGCIIAPPHRGPYHGYSHDHRWHDHDGDRDDHDHDDGHRHH